MKQEKDTGLQMQNTDAFQCPPAIDRLETGVICCRLDEGLTVLWANSGFFKSIHETREAFHRRCRDLNQFYLAYPGDFIQLQTAVFRLKEQDGGSVKLYVRIPLTEGGFFRAQLTVSLCCGPAAEPVFQAELTDVSALLTENESLTRRYQQNFQYFCWMMDTYAGNVYISDMDTYELLYLNQSACETLHASAGQVLGRKCYEVIQGRDHPCPFCTNDKLQENTFYEWEFDNPALDKTFMIKNRRLEWNGRRARIELSHDMQSTEFKLAKKDQERNAIIQTMPGGFVRVDARDMQTVLWYGGGFLSLIGYTKEEFKRDLHSQCTYVHPDDLNRSVQMMNSARETGKKTVMEGRIITRDGTIKILTITYSYVSAKESWDGIPSFYSAAIDVTREREEQSRQRQALEDAYQSARIANDAKTNFLSTMSHDIRTPMNAIMGMSVIARANLNNPERVRDCLDKISSSSSHLLGLINEVLDMSKIESGKIDLSSEPVSLPDLVEEVMNICRPLVTQKHQTLQVSADHVRHETVLTDRGRLQQVLMNLLSNAIKYTPNGGTISLRLRERPCIIPDRGQYEFIVTDNGIGMSDAFVQHIFEPFTRAEDSRISKIQGTGLGMTITENIVRMMNGTIEVKSRLETGSQFIFAVTLALCKEENIFDPKLAGRQVLVVDDDPVVCESAVEILEELGMRGEWVLSGKEAVARVMETHEKGADFFCVILDWQMPGMDGLETLKVLREKAGSQLPVVIISAYDYSDVETEFRLAGANAFLSKPLFKSKITHAFRRFCQDGSSEPAPAPVNPRSSFAGRRILLVEDNELNLEIAAELLQMQGFVVEAAVNGHQAVEKFQASAPGTYSCVLMDIQMPVMDGYRATEAIRASDREDALHIPILALTANAFASDFGKALHAGMNDHIAKPIDPQHLINVLQRWLK